ncbi:MAG: hypothetical protein HZB51_32870 [Chloroflexi bacterium]|nr:hypothetical protein [Chloroflexota bacterium]
MPKKTRKMKQRSAMRRSVSVAQETQVAEEEEQVAAETKPVMTTRNVLPPSNRGMTPATYDYSHIYGDLRRIAMFAAFFFIVLIALSFVIK